MAKDQANRPKRMAKLEEKARATARKLKFVEGKDKQYHLRAAQKVQDIFAGRQQLAQAPITGQPLDTSFEDKNESHKTKMHVKA